MEQKVFEIRKNSKHNKSCLLDEACLRIKTESPNANYDTSLHMFECWVAECSQNILIIICLHPPPSHTPPLATAPCCFHSVAGQRSRLPSKYHADHVVDQKIKIPTWYCLEDEVVMFFDSYFTFESRFRWHRLILTVESTRGIRTLVVVYELLKEMFAWGSQK